MSTRIVRMTDEHRDLALEQMNGVGLASAFDAAPDEATLPTVLVCAEHGIEAERIGCFNVERCEVRRVPLPVHLGVEVTP